MKDAAVRVDELLDVLEEFDLIVHECGVPALVRAVRMPPAVIALADLVAQLTEEQLLELARARRERNWTTWRDFAQAIAREVRAEDEAAELERAAARATEAGRQVA